jgi:hypothetical protein
MIVLDVFIYRREIVMLAIQVLSAKLVPTFADTGVSHGQCGGSLVNL